MVPLILSLATALLLSSGALPVSPACAAEPQKPARKVRAKRKAPSTPRRSSTGGDVQIGNWEDPGDPEPAAARAPAEPETPAASAPSPAPAKRRRARREPPPAEGTRPSEQPGAAQPAAAPAPPPAAPKPAVTREEAAAARAAPRVNRVPGIYPVYEAGGRWLLLDRSGKRSTLEAGAEFVVIGSRGAGIFTAERSTKTWIAACSGSRHVATGGFLLSAAKRKEFKRTGTPVIAILLRDKKVDLSKAWFYPLKNGLGESEYRRLDGAVRKAVVRDLESGAYLIPLEDEAGLRIAREPRAEDVQYVLEFGAKLRFPGLKEPFFAIERTQVSQTSRRCLRFFDGDAALGECAEMPHALMVETRGLEFVAYDPSRKGFPFVFAFTREAPLWGHERWGFQFTRKGPRLFLSDALEEPRCRGAF